MSTVSVILPTYNAARYISQAINSILAQTHVPDEVIIIDDGSTDDTDSVLGAIHDSRIVVVHQENQGIAAARNRGLELAKGQFIAFLDADDLWRPRMVETQLSLLETRPEVVYCFTNFVRFQEGLGPMPRDQFSYYSLNAVPSIPGPIERSRVIVNDPFSALVGMQEIPCFLQVRMFRAQLIADIRFDESLTNESDVEFCLRTSLRGSVAYLPDCLADVRRHNDNISKDHAYSPVWRLRALKALERNTAIVAQNPAFRDRLVKAYIDAAGAHAARGEIGTALSVFLESLETPGSSSRKLKGAARLALRLAQGMRIRTE